MQQLNLITENLETVVRRLRAATTPALPLLQNAEPSFRQNSAAFLASLLDFKKSIEIDALLRFEPPSGEAAPPARDALERQARSEYAALESVLAGLWDTPGPEGILPKVQLLGLLSLGHRPDLNRVEKLSAAHSHHLRQAVSLVHRESAHKRHVLTVAIHSHGAVAQKLEMLDTALTVAMRTGKHSLFARLAPAYDAAFCCAMRAALSAVSKTDLEEAVEIAYQPDGWLRRHHELGRQISFAVFQLEKRRLQGLVRQVMASS